MDTKEIMDLLNLGTVTWEESQFIYHALADLGRETLVLLSPKTPYVCIGYHQDVEAEVDLAFCRSREIPVFRRQVGGGAVYLDGNQYFFQLILHEDNPIIPPRKAVFYQKFLQPVINTYRRIGIPAEYKAINDVVTGNRKISGTGVGEIGNCVVFVGNLIMDFDFSMMARVLKLPDEKFRDKVHKTMMENLTTIQRELGEEKAAEWTRERLNALMTKEFQPLLGELTQKTVDDELKARAVDMGRKMTSRKWLFQNRRKHTGREVKIQADVKLVQKMHKATGGLIRASYEVRNGCFLNVCFSGDFFCYPVEAVEHLSAALEGTPLQDAEAILKAFYGSRNQEFTGIEMDDWLSILM